MTDTSVIQAYISEGSKEVEGWFYGPDMELFYYLDLYQKRVQISGDICELGVYAGKSLALLAMLARKEENIYGLDLFLEDYLEKTKETIVKFCPETKNIEYVVGDSADYTSESISKTIRQPLRLLHIDAGHEYHEVLHSLYLLSPYLSNDGVIIMDDYHDREFPGIESAILDFCRETSPRQFVPFMSGGNKMYLATKPAAIKYQTFIATMNQYAGKLRVSMVRDNYILVTRSKRPMPQEEILERIAFNAVPYNYSIDLEKLTSNARKYGQFKSMGKI